MDFQSIIAELHAFWRDRGCLILEGYDRPKGAATLGPETLLRALGPEPCAIAYVDPCRRPSDSRHGRAESDRYQRYYQYQVLLKPTVFGDAAQELFRASLERLGVAGERVRFTDDWWESPVFGAAGSSWEVWLEGAEIAQLTWFDHCAGIACSEKPLEITYGLERLAQVVQGVDSFAAIRWGGGRTYGEILLASEVQQSSYNLDVADPALLLPRLEGFVREARQLTDRGLFYPALDALLDAAHAFNVLDARRALTEEARLEWVATLRAGATEVGRCYLASRASRA